MAKWSRAQISVMARAVGWGEYSDDVAWVAMAESGGDDKVVNSIGCVGLLQINQPVHVSAHPKWTRSWLQDPMNNLSAGLVLFKAAGKSFAQPWADSKHRGGIPEGWGPHVDPAAGGTGPGGGAQQVDDDPCALLKGPAREYCLQEHGQGGDLGGGLLESAPNVGGELGRIAQAIAKGANWIGDPGNWVRIAYVTGGAVLALVAVNTIVQPYVARGYRQVVTALPVQTVRKMRRAAGSSTSTEGE